MDLKGKGRNFQSLHAVIVKYLPEKVVLCRGMWNMDEPMREVRTLTSDNNSDIQEKVWLASL